MIKKLLCFFVLSANYLFAQSFTINEPLLINPTYKVYLSVNGSDFNSGDSIAPLATFVAALNKLDQITGNLIGNVYGEVVLFSGTYNEIFKQPLNKFLIGQKYLNVSLRGKESVILDGTTLTVNAGGGMIYLLGSNIYVKNIKVVHSNENGVRFGYNYAGTIINSHDVLVDNVTVSETAGHGILAGVGALNANGSSTLIPRAKRFKISNCHVYNSVNYNTPQSQWGSAIKFWNTSNSIATNNHVHDNSGEGIDFDFCDSADVRKNTLHDNYANIYLDKMEYAHLHENLIYNESKVVSGILTGLEAFSSFVTTHFMKNILIENNIVLNTLGINLWQGIYSALQNGVYANITIRHNTIIGKQRGNGALVSISHETILGQPVANFSINGIIIEGNIMSANIDSLNNNKLISAPLNPQPGLTAGKNLYNMNPGFGYNTVYDQIQTNISQYEAPSNAVLNLTPNTNLHPELIMSISGTCISDFHGEPRSVPTTNVGAIELNENVRLNSFTDSDSDLLLYPNPCSGKLNIKLNNISKSYKITAYDLKGNLVYVNKAEALETLILNELEDGIYTFIVILETGNVLCKKLQVLK